MDVDNEFEYGVYAKHSFDRGDVALSYYKGNDRVFNAPLAESSIVEQL